MNRVLITFLMLILPTAVFGALKLTIYDDGRSCPAACDSHVVFHHTLNGSKYAHMPGSVAPNFDACNLDYECEICFEDDGSECLTTMYRGTGPGENTFDLTPAFYEEWCNKESVPTRLSEKCLELERTASKLNGRVNCIKEQSHARCHEMMEHALEAKEADAPHYAECNRLGQREFNRNRSTSEMRIHSCGYEFESNGGPNSNGLTWHRLLPAACREGTFVGRDGLDCCSGNKFVDAALGVECRTFYPHLE